MRVGLRQHLERAGLQRVAGQDRGRLVERLVGASVCPAAGRRRPSPAGRRAPANRRAASPPRRRPARRRSRRPRTARRSPSPGRPAAACRRPAWHSASPRPGAPPRPPTGGSSASSAVSTARRRAPCRRQVDSATPSRSASLASSMTTSTPALMPVLINGIMPTFAWPRMPPCHVANCHVHVWPHMPRLASSGHCLAYHRLDAISAHPAHCRADRCRARRRGMPYPSPLSWTFGAIRRQLEMCHDPRRPGPAPRLLRRRRAGDRDRRAGAEEIRPADLCSSRNRAQPPRRGGPADPRRGVRRRTGRDPAGRDDRLLRPRRGQAGRAAGRRARTCR